MKTPFKFTLLDKEFLILDHGVARVGDIAQIVEELNRGIKKNWEKWRAAPTGPEIIWDLVDLGILPESFNSLSFFSEGQSGSYYAISRQGGLKSVSADTETAFILTRPHF